MHRTTLVVASALALAGAAVATAQSFDLADPFDAGLMTRPAAPDGDLTPLSVSFSAEEVAAAGGMEMLVPRGTRDVPRASINTDPEGDAPAAAVFTPDGSQLIVAHRATKNLTIYDAATRDFVASIALSGAPVDVAITSDGLYAVTANITEDNASIVDLMAGVEAGVVPVGDGPYVSRITPNNATAVIGCFASGEIYVIDIATAGVERVIPDIAFYITMSVNFEQVAIAVSASNPFAIASDTVAIFPDYASDRLRFVDIATGAINDVACSARPQNVAITPDGTRAVVSHTGSSAEISVVDVAAQSITRTYGTVDTPRGPIAITPTGTKAAVHVLNATRIVDLASGAVSSSLNTASVYGLLTTADGQYAVGVGYYGSIISYATEQIVANTNSVVSTSVGAVSPTAPRAALLSTTFGNDLVMVNTDGGSGHLDGYRFSGPAPEGDKTRTLAVSPDGSKVVTANSFSDNVTVFDAASRTILGYSDAGQRTGEVKITPDGSLAVVANRDDNFVSLVDLDTITTTNVTISRRGDQIEISPDGQYAYIAVIADGDGVWRVDLDTASVAGAKLGTGNMGGIYYAGNQFSGMELSHDGGTIVTCDTYSDAITVIDTAAWSVVATVAVGDFPVRAVFAPDDARMYIANRDSESISIVSNDGGNSMLLRNIPLSGQPFEMAFSPDGTRLYVLLPSAPAVAVVDIAAQQVVATVPLPDTPVGLFAHPDGERVFVANGNATTSTAGGLTQTEDGRVSVIDSATNTIVETIATERWGVALAANPTGTLLATANLVDESVSFISLVEFIVGDMNCDGAISPADIDPFVIALTGGQAAYEAQFPDCNYFSADVNGDGVVSAADIDPFVLLLTAP
jgi:YVTN family beta-propeller protein